jgi:crotonobetainyl-CoA:carnitine CoA-transferase CaiB-like acyl-CoA transferase
VPEPLLPLADVRVLDLTRFPPGGFCTLMLSELGAQVCRVVSPTGAPGYMPATLARGKRSASVDLRHDRANDVLRRLAAWADVLVESERPGAMDERGFGASHARSELPALVWCSLSGYGQDGPYVRLPGHDLSYVAHSGLLAAIAPLPWYPQATLAIPVGALMGVIGIQAALRERDRTGRGCHLDISLSESATWLLSQTDEAVNGVPFGIPVTPDRYLYECADGAYVTLASSEPRTWKALCEALGFDDLVDTLFRWEDPAAVTERFAAVFTTRPAAEWVAELAPRGVAIVRANHGADLRDDPHVQARDTLQSLGDLLVPRNPVRFVDADGPRPPRDAQPPSEPAADTADVLAEAGLTPEEIAELASSGAVVVA